MFLDLSIVYVRVRQIFSVKSKTVFQAVRASGRRLQLLNSVVVGGRQP